MIAKLVNTFSFPDLIGLVFFGVLIVALLYLPFSVTGYFRTLRLFRMLNVSPVHERAVLLVTPPSQALVKNCRTKHDVTRTLSVPQNAGEESLWVWSLAPEHLLPRDRPPTAAELCALPYEGVYLEFDPLGVLTEARFRPLSERREKRGRAPKAVLPPACDRKFQSS